MRTGFHGSRQPAHKIDGARGARRAPAARERKHDLERASGCGNATARALVLGILTVGVDREVDLILDGGDKAEIRCRAHGGASTGVRTQLARRPARTAHARPVLRQRGRVAGGAGRPRRYAALCAVRVAARRGESPRENSSSLPASPPSLSRDTER